MNEILDFTVTADDSLYVNGRRENKCYGVEPGKMGRG
jgi:hypothetical protein